MESNEIAEPIDLLLSRDELVYVLSLLKVTAIPGLDDDPAGELTPAEQTVALRVAERGLRAKQLMLRGDGDEVLLHNTLQAAIGACAFGQAALSVFHWPVGEEFPTPFYAHVRDQARVVHTRPADVLHYFSLRPTQEDFATSILTACGYADTPDNGTYSLMLPGQLLAEIRATAGTDTTASVERLTAQGSARESAQAFVSTLAQPYRVSNLQGARQQNGSVARQDHILLQDDEHTWLATGKDAEFSEVTVRTVSRADVQQLVTDWLTV